VTLEPGTHLGRYELQAPLGAGGMGAVYKAYDRDIEREIALKVIRPDLASSPELLQRFKQELLLARQIAHKNVVRIFDVRESAGIKFITMEYIDGRDLRSLLGQHGKLPAAEALDIMHQVCLGLAAAHAPPGEAGVHLQAQAERACRRPADGPVHQLVALGQLHRCAGGPGDRLRAFIAHARGVPDDALELAEETPPEPPAHRGPDSMQAEAAEDSMPLEPLADGSAA